MHWAAVCQTEFWTSSSGSLSDVRYVFSCTKCVYIIHYMRCISFSFHFWLFIFCLVSARQRNFQCVRIADISHPLRTVFRICRHEKYGNDQHSEPLRAKSKQKKKMLRSDLLRYLTFALNDSHAHIIKSAIGFPFIFFSLSILQRAYWFEILYQIEILLIFYAPYTNACFSTVFIRLHWVIYWVDLLNKKKRNSNLSLSLNSLKCNEQKFINFVWNSFHMNGLNTWINFLVNQHFWRVRQLLAHELNKTRFQQYVSHRRVNLWMHPNPVISINRKHSVGVVTDCSYANVPQ